MYVFNSMKIHMNAPQRLKLAATMKILAQGGYQHRIGQDRHLGHPSQQTVSSCLTEVCQVVEEILCPKHIVFEIKKMN